MSNDNDQLDANEAAAFLGCSVSFIRKAKAQNKVGFTQIGSRYTFSKDALLKLIKKVEPHIAEPSLE